MPFVPESSSVSEDPAVVNDYDSFAEAYSAGNEASLINGYYTRPAILDLAGDVAGRRILDVGCGSGPISAALRDGGATVAGFDSSTKMVELARKRLGPDADLQIADLGRPLPYPDGAFDDVIAALVMHYLQDWTARQREAGHDFDYFATYNWSEEWIQGGHTAQMSFWTRPLHAMTDAFTAAGFRTAVVSEPSPASGARELFPDRLPDTPSGAFLCFLFFVLEAD